MVVRQAARRPTKLAIRFGDRVLVDACMTFPHQAIFGKFPVLVAIDAEPLAAVVAIFAGISDGNAVAGASDDVCLYWRETAHLAPPLEGFGHAAARSIRGKSISVSRASFT